MLTMDQSDSSSSGSLSSAGCLKMIMLMSLEEARRSQRPYRYGMMLLCLGALINWLGLAENYSEPVRYAGVACILSGALLICTAMCCWLHTPIRANTTSPEQQSANADDPIHVIAVNEAARLEKPPDYNSIIEQQPPSYDDAIKLNPALLPYAYSSNDTFHILGFSGVPSPPPSAPTNRPSSSTEALTIENLDGPSVEIIDEKRSANGGRLIHGEMPR